MPFMSSASSLQMKEFYPSTFGVVQLASERIYWDQASVLVQLGLLDPILLPGKPVSGAEQAAKVLDFSSVQSNRAIATAHDLH
jgi:hypothetical protein